MQLQFAVLESFKHKSILILYWNWMNENREYGPLSEYYLNKIQWRKNIRRRITQPTITFQHWAFKKNIPVNNKYLKPEQAKIDGDTRGKQVHTAVVTTTKQTPLKAQLKLECTVCQALNPRQLHKCKHKLIFSYKARLSFNSSSLLD